MERTESETLLVASEFELIQNDLMDVQNTLMLAANKLIKIKEETKFFLKNSEDILSEDEKEAMRGIIEQGEQLSKYLSNLATL